MSPLDWLRPRDPGFVALRRAARAAIVMPGLFAFALEVLKSPTIATFTAFSAMSTLLFVDFTGTRSERVVAQSLLVAVGALLVALGTLAAQHAWTAVLATALVAFAVLFSGVVSSVLASATTPLLVAFILPVTFPGPVASIPTRLLGWLLGGGASLLAITFLWPAPTREPLRASTASACSALARRLRAEVDCFQREGAERRRVRDQLVAESDAVLAELRRSFYATPYRPTALATPSRTLVRLVDQLLWLDAVLQQSPLDHAGGTADGRVCGLKLAAADLLEQSGALLEEGAGDASTLRDAAGRLALAREEMREAVIGALPVRRAPIAPGIPERSASEFVTSLEPSFRAEEASFAVASIALDVERTVAARERGWWSRLLGRQPAGTTSTLSTAQQRAGSHLERHSVWLHNSVRGAVALALAVLVVEATAVQHSFWVVFGTLAVLRSSAFNTGQNALRAMVGTTAGFLVGGGLIALVGANTTLSWLLLPVAVLFAGLAPAAISFTAGQAGFTAVFLILANIVAPTGWRVGIVRVEDVAIGAAVSLSVGVLFWPRGAASSLGQAMGEAMADGALYLLRAVEYGVTRCDALLPSRAAPGEEQQRATAAALRLDDAFRGFLAERGGKQLPLAEVTTLLTGVGVLRLLGDAVTDLWDDDGAPPDGDRSTARNEILAVGGELARWYVETASAMAGAGPVPRELPHDLESDGRLIEAVRHDLSGGDGQGSATAVKMIWTADHLDEARRLQQQVAGPAAAVARLVDRPRGSIVHIRT